MTSLGRPTVIIAHTVKGKGLSLAEGVHTWHSIVPSPQDFERARQELEPDEIALLDHTTNTNSRTPTAAARSESRWAETLAQKNGASA